MSTYVIGDIQGCYGALTALLETLKFDQRHDQLIVAGDMVSRGDNSLATMRLLYEMRHAVKGVLGNHDLHLLALAHQVGETEDADLLAILNAHDSQELLGWLQSFPLAIHLPEHNTVITHAGWPPQWSLTELLQYSQEVEHVLASQQALTFFQQMYGNSPTYWDNDLTGTTRWRVITNFLTRMRFITLDYQLDLKQKSSPHKAPDHLMPWFAHPQHKRGDTKILFGHWAALKGEAYIADVEALDTGCVWGGCLTAYCLENGERYSVNCQ